jgi:glutathione S-transferase
LESNLSLPSLYVFAISHYCEKARWALDWHGIGYELKHLAPGSHMQVAKQLGAPGTSVPILALEDRVVQGSGAIIDWAESQCADSSKRLNPDPKLEDECRAFEKRLDDVMGVHARRYYYSEALVEYPETVLPIFTNDLAPAERLALEENWGLVQKLMRGAMDLGPEQRIESRKIVSDELDWLDDRFADGRRFMLGDRFSRADLTAASLIAPLARPKEHPTYGHLVVPPQAQADFEAWKNRPIVEWISGIYRNYR